MRFFRWMFIAVLAGFVTSSTAFTADEKTADQKLTPEQQARIERMKAFMAPGAPHQVLQPLVGKWNYRSKFWMSVGSEPEESTGTADHTMAYGGRFLLQQVKGTWMGEPFLGSGVIGYDNIREQYEMVWLDSMSTSMMRISGQYNAATHTLSQSGSNSCPLTGEKDRKGHSDWQIIDMNRNIYTTYLTDNDGREFKAMEIIYERAK